MNYRKIECKICGKKIKLISWSHLKLHNITVEEYKKQFPSTTLISKEGSNFYNIKRKEEYNTGIRKSYWNGKTRSEETRKKMIKSHIERYALVGGHSEETKENIRLTKLGEKNPMFGKKPHNFGKTKENYEPLMRMSKKNSVAGKKLWQNKEYREKQIKVIFEGFKLKPNKPEKRLIKIIKKYNLQFKYTGDGSFWIGGLNPDFVECNGKKIVIEIFGKYWHSPLLNKTLTWNKTLPGRREILKKYGWKLIVLWEHEIYKNEDYVANKIKKLN